ncbi:hydroxyphenylacetyl-CoA thioesterase PaaI [Kribbella sp. NBC_01245]|uniref:hydroxyphenylacetyl-CoA thioesterase PaaI n=1 Tax=Kribbella sp. NBC_01245 TaxID=2903578 RepID=UPI002E296351|nr:hydroxyphenylacetyl-CoA thioesterase PaaI [Kribbella sp. NBC_01245]
MRSIVDVSPVPRGACLGAASAKEQQTPDTSDRLDVTVNCRFVNLVSQEGDFVDDRLAERVAAAMWAEDAASVGLGMRIVDVGAGRATVEMTIRDDMVNGHGMAHGGFVFALADSAFSFACNSGNVTTVAQACDIVFVAPAQRGDVLVAEAVGRASYGRNGIYDVTVRCGDQLIAEFRGRSRQIGGTIVEEHA